MSSSRIISWIKKNQKEFLVLTAILLLAVFLRFYRLDEYMQFLGDQGRDALVVKKILVEHHLPAIGPPMSVGDVYLGPLYYYMMAISMALFWLNPVAATGMVALIGVISVGLIYYLTKEWFGQNAAIIAALLYSISPVAINYSRFSWNPNPVPFFTLLSFLGFYQAHRSGDFRWLILSGASVAAAIQMHYLTLILLGIFGVLWLYELSLILRKKMVRKYFIWGSGGAIFIFLLMMSPLAFFDLKHGFLNYHGLIDLFAGQNEGVKFTLVDSVGRLPETYSNNLIGRYIAGQNQILSIVISFVILVPLAIGFIDKYKGGRLRWTTLMLAVWLGVGFLGLMFYKREIYDHYLAFLSPLPFILIGAFCQIILELKLKKTLAAITIIIAITVVTIINLAKNPLLYPPNRQLERTQQMAQFIIQQSEGKPFNFALLAKNNYDAAYQFYLEQFGYKPKKVPDEKTGQLFVICEDPICQPVGHPKYEIAAFGWTRIEWEKNVDGIRVFKLIPNPAQLGR